MGLLPEPGEPCSLWTRGRVQSATTQRRRRYGCGRCLRSARRFVALAAVAAAMFAGSEARADGRAELEKARASFRARNWVDAEERLHVLLDPLLCG